MTQQIRTVNIKGKQYVDVAERVRLAHADKDSDGFSMVAQERYQIGSRWFLSITIEVKGKLYIGDAEIKFDAKTGTPDGSNPLECAQTSALGRALGYAGYGILQSIASADEVRHAGNAGENLGAAIKQVKERALSLGAAKDAEEWRALLTSLNIQRIATQDDIETIDEYLDMVEYGAQVGQ